MQGFVFTVAHAQECKWDDVGSAEPIRDFLQAIVESMLRLNGPAAPLKPYNLSSAAETYQKQYYDFFEAEKLDPEHTRELREYMAKHGHWMGSYLALDKLEVDGVFYCAWLHQNADYSHRMDDPRGNPMDAPTTCACDKVPVLKKCKKVGKKGDPKNIGRQFYVCSNADEDGCEFFRWIDEPGAVGPLKLNLNDLVDTRFPRSDEASPESVVRAGLCFAEACYYMKVIANEVALQKKRTGKFKQPSYKQDRDLCVFVCVMAIFSQTCVSKNVLLTL